MRGEGVRGEGVRSVPSPITRHLSPVTYHPSPITHHLSPITRHLSPVTRHPSLPPVSLIVGHDGVDCLARSFDRQFGDLLAHFRDDLPSLVTVAGTSGQLVDAVQMMDPDNAFGEQHDGERDRGDVGGQPEDGLQGLVSQLRRVDRLRLGPPRRSLATDGPT